MRLALTIAMICGLNTVIAAESIVEVCEKSWEANKGDCSGFVKTVAKQFSIELSGQANDIIDSISGKDTKWTKLKDGKEAKNKAKEGFLVVAGLKDKPNGHVVIVVDGPLAKEKYPTAYWGKLDGVGKKKETLNYAWKEKDLDKVEYYAIKP